MRKPSIHISEDDLVKVLKELIPNNGALAWDMQNLAKDILIRGRKYSIANRGLLVDTKKKEKKAIQLLSSTKGDAMLLATIIYTLRKQMRHVGVATIKEGSKDWGIVKEAAGLALEFCNEFGFDKKNGFVEYLKIAISKMNKFSIMKVPSMHSGIIEAYQAKLDIEKDNSPPLTELAHSTYNQILNERIGLGDTNYRKIPEKYIYFVKAVEISFKLGISVDHYIRAQFHGMSYRNGVPDPVQLIGDKAEERAKNYMYEKGIKTGHHKESAIDFTKLKRFKK